MNPGPYETDRTIRLHRRALMLEAERERLLSQAPARSLRRGLLLARTGRFLIAIGTRLEARYASPALSAVGHGPHAD